jgi:hypothetical protein
VEVVVPLVARSVHRRRELPLLSDPGKGGLEGCRLADKSRSDRAELRAWNGHPGFRLGENAPWF